MSGPNRPEWALIKEKDGEFTLAVVLKDGEYGSEVDDKMREIARGDMTAKYHMAFIEDSWTYT